MRQRSAPDDRKGSLLLAVLNQKGGVGKSTLSTNLAAAAHLEGRRTLLVDCDKQGSVFDWYSERGDASKLAGLTVVRADKALSLPKIREMVRGYDVAILDGPPQLGDVTRAAGVAADVVLIPVRPGAFDTWACSETLKSLDSADEIRGELGRPGVRRVIVVNGAPPRARTVDFALDALRGAAELAPVVIGNRVLFVAAAASGEAVLTQAPDTPAGREILALWSVLTSEPKAREEGEHVRH